MDGLRERLLATLIGAIGTTFGVMAIEVIPRYLQEDLRWRSPQMWIFLAMLLVIGGTGGSFGHWAFLHIARGDLEKRAIIVGGSVGLLIGLSTWLMTFLLFDVMFPFEVVPGARLALIDRSLTNALFGGTLGGVLVSLAVARHLRRSGHPMAQPR